MADENKDTREQQLRQALLEQAFQLQYLQQRLTSLSRALGSVHTRLVDALEIILSDYGLSFIDITESSPADFRRWVKEQGWQYNLDPDHPDVQLILKLIEARTLIDRVMDDIGEFEEGGQEG